MTIGRPSSYDDETAQRIIDRLASGEPMKRICADDDMPSYTTVLRWQTDFPAFRDLSTRAKQDGTHALADECLTISDDLQIDPQHKKIMVDTRIRLIGKWNRVDYGDKVVQELVGKDGGPIEVAHTARDRIADRLARLAPVVPAVDDASKGD